MTADKQIQVLCCGDPADCTRPCERRLEYAFHSCPKPPWTLTDADKRFLKSTRIGPE